MQQHMEAHSLFATLGKQDSNKGEWDGLDFKDYKVGLILIPILYHLIQILDWATATTL